MAIRARLKLCTDNKWGGLVVNGALTEFKGLPFKPRRENAQDGSQVFVLFCSVSKGIQSKTIQTQKQLIQD